MFWELETVSIIQFISDSSDDEAQIDAAYADSISKVEYVTFSTVVSTGFSSREYFTTSDVPQDSNLGHMLFVLFHDDLLESLTSDTKVCAENDKMYSRVDCVDDMVNLQ
ncbi:hypothetical protein Trydic_g19011 [Trypoxylus dichotomus]